MIIFHKFMNVKINLLLCHTQPPLSFFFKFISSTIRFSLFNWSRVDLQCCISFRCTEKWFRYIWASLVAQKVNDLPATQKTQARSLGWEDPLEKGMATHSSILAWRITRTEEPDGLQSMRLQESDMTEHLTLFMMLLFSRSVMSDPLQPLWTTARQVSLSTISWSLLKLMSVESVMPS